MAQNSEISVSKTCPICGPATMLTLRQNAKTRIDFLGCTAYPECEYTEPLPTDILMRRQGAEMLQGFGDCGIIQP